MTLWITPKAAQRVLDELHALGYAGATLSGLDPDTEGFHNFRGQKVEMVCAHETAESGEIFESWSLATISQT